MTDREDLYDRIRFLITVIGAVPSPFECYLANRGIKTLDIRMQKHMKNGLDVARFLETHPAVERVLHPGNNVVLHFTCWHLFIKTIM